MTTTVDVPRDTRRHSPAARRWTNWAVATLEAESGRTADTHLHRVPLPPGGDVLLYLKDESSHPTGSLKHRLARSLFLYAVCNGWLNEGTPVIESSSGSTAISEAYFARLLGLPFIAVIPRNTSAEKIALIQRHGGTCHLVDDPTMADGESRRLAERLGGHYMDQFTYAERATDWRGNNNIAESTFGQLRHEPYPEPRWIVVGAGTGGTSATIGRYLRHRRHSTLLCVVDPEHSAYFPSWDTQDPGYRTGRGSRIEGIGRPGVEPSFVPGVIDRMIQVPDAASIAAAEVFHRLTGFFAGPSTGTNLYGALRTVCEMRAAGETGSVVTLWCDKGERYTSSCFDPAWQHAQGLDVAAYAPVVETAMTEGVWPDGPPATQSRHDVEAE